MTKRRSEADEYDDPPPLSTADGAVFGPGEDYLTVSIIQSVEESLGFAVVPDVAVLVGSRFEF